MLAWNIYLHGGVVNVWDQCGNKYSSPKKEHMAITKMDLDLIPPVKLFINVISDINGCFWFP